MMLIFRAFCAAMLFLAFSSHSYSAHAQLTDDSVRDFIEETTQITSGQDLDASADDIRNYLKRHLAPKSRFKSTVTFSVPGFPTQRKALSLKKKDFIDSVIHGQKSLTHYETAITVETIRISKDGRKASVTTSGIESGFMPVPGEDGDEDIPVDGTSECSQIITLNDSNVIQMYHANCKTNIVFSGF